MSTAPPEKLELNDLGDDALLAHLREKFTPEPVPPCALCGAALTLVHEGGFCEERVWACDGLEDHPENHGRMRFKAGRFVGDDHYEKSRWVQCQPGDAYVMEMVKRFERR